MDRQPVLYLNPFDGLIYITHICKHGRETVALPHPFWHLDEDGVLAPGCKLYCDPATDGCGLYIERWPVTGSVIPKSPASAAPEHRTLSAWRRLASFLMSKLRSSHAGR